MKLPIFSHRIKTRYSETDKMGLIHHSVYAIYLEETRTAFWESLGYPYYKMEDEGYFVVVTSIEISYKKPLFYGDTIRVDISNFESDGLKFSYFYNIYNETRDYHSSYAKSSHVFVNREKKVIRIPSEINEIIRKFLQV